VWNGKRSVPARVVKTGKKPVYEIHLDNGQIVRASKDHRFLVLENGRTSWAAVEDIRPGDAICRAKPLMRESDGAPSRIDERRVHGRDIKLPFDVDESIATVVEVKPSGKTEMMYDVITNSVEHMFWVDGVIAHNCHVCLAMYRDEDLKASKRMLISIMEHREGEDFSMLIRWDLNEMNFEFIRQVQASELIPEKGGGGAGVAAVSF
jgi:hypothetical protein